MYERRTDVFSIQDIMALTSGVKQDNSVKGLEKFIEKWKAHKNGLPTGVTLMPALEESLFEAQVKDYTCLKTYIDMRIVELDRDHKVHTHQWLWDCCIHYIPKTRQDQIRKGVKEHVNGNDKALGLAGSQSGKG